MTATVPFKSKLPLSEKIGFGVGELGNNLFWQFFMYFQLFFYTDVFKIADGANAARVAGEMFFAVKIFDALFDVFIGFVADRTKTRWGKYRPYLLFGAIPLGIACIVAFTTPNLQDANKLIYAYITYTFLMMMYSLVAIPQNSLLGVMTDDVQERTILSKYKFLFAFSAGLIVQFFTPILVDVFGKGNEQKGFEGTLWVYAILATTLFVFSFFTVRERVSPPAGQKMNFAQDVKDLLKNGPWLILIPVTLMSIIHIAIRGATLAHYFKYYVKDQQVDTILFGVHQFTHGKLLGTTLVLGTLCSILGTTLVPTLSRIFGKKYLYIILISASSIITALNYFVGPDQVLLVIAIHMVSSIFLGPTSAVLWPMYADCADYSEWRNNRRATALTFSAAIMSQKFGWAFAGWVSGALLTSFGYVADTDLNQETLHGLILMVSILPALFGFAAAGITLFYNLNEKRLQTIETELKARRANS